MTHSKHAVAGWLLMVAAVAVLAAHLISDTSGAQLELAPVFVGAALAVAAMRMFRSRPGRAPVLTPTIAGCPHRPLRSASWLSRVTSESTCGC